MKPSNK